MRICLPAWVHNSLCCYFAFVVYVLLQYTTFSISNMAPKKMHKANAETVVTTTTAMSSSAQLPPLLVGLEGDGEVLRDRICSFLDRGSIVALM